MNESPRILLDGVPEDELGPPPSGRSLLGSDPFAETPALDDLLGRLEALVETLPEGPPGRGEARAPERPPRPRRLPRRRRPSIPPLSDIETPEPEGILERLVDDAARRRVAALEHLVEEGCAYDRFGLSPRALRAALPAFLALYRGWFRVESLGAENLPREGGAVLASNHAGLLPFDGAMTVVDVLLHTDPPRLVRSVLDRWAGSLPWLNVFFARVGQIVGTRQNFAELLGAGHFVLVFPEGMDGIRKPVTQRYRLQSFRVGFVEQALRARVPIVPMAVLGSDDQAPILADLKPLARLLRLPVVPITPTFPWLGPLGLLPYPVRYRIVYGEPLAFHERFGPEHAEDARLVGYLANQVRRAVQHLMDRHR